MDLQNATNRIAAQGEMVTKIKDEVGKVIVGQEKLIDRLVLALVTDGHILLDGQLPDRDPLAQTRKEAQLVKATLAAAGWNGAVTPVLAFASDTFRQHMAEVQGAVVMNSCELANGFATQRVVIPPAELERLIALMESNS